MPTHARRGALGRSEAGDPLADLIRERAASWYPSLGSSPCTVRRLPGNPCTLNQMALYEVGAPGGFREVVLAKRLRAGHPPGLVEQEYRLLAEAHGRAVAGEGFAVPRPLAHLPGSDTLLMEWVGGESLYDVVARLNSALPLVGDRERCERLVARCGRLLRAFHHADPGLAPQPFGGSLDEELFGKCLVALEYLRERRGLPAPLVERVRRTLEAGRARLAGRSVPLVHQHGDFFLRNVVLRGDALFLVDFTYAIPNVMQNDLATFLTRLAKMHPYPAHPFFDQRAKPRYARAFLAGYFPGGGPAAGEEELLRLYTLRHLVVDCRYRHQRYTAAGAAGRLYYRFLASGYARLVGEVLDEIDGAR